MRMISDDVSWSSGTSSGGVNHSCLRREPCLCFLFFLLFLLYFFFFLLLVLLIGSSREGAV